MKAIAEKFSAGSKDALLAALFERHPAWYTYRRHLADWRFDWYGFTQAVTEALMMEHLTALKDPCTGHIGPAYDIVNLGYVDSQKFLPLAFRFRIKSEKELAPDFKRPRGGTL